MVHFGYTSVKLAKNGQYFNSRILLKGAEVKLTLFYSLELWFQQTSGLYFGQN